MGFNGMEFVIMVVDMLELEELVLVIGEVLEGMGVVEKMREVKIVRDNMSFFYFK